MSVRTKLILIFLSLSVVPLAALTFFSYTNSLHSMRNLVERENRSLDGLRLSPATPTAIFLGKVAGNIVFVGVVELVSLPLFVLFYDVAIWRQVPLLIGVIAMATVAFVAVGTLLSAMVVRTRFSEVMLPVLLLPFLVPPIVSAVQLTWRILADRPLAEMTGWLSLLGSFDIVFFILSLLLFDAIITE